MRAGLATRPADRMTRVVMMTTAALSGLVMFGVALPLAVSSPYPVAGQGHWILASTAPTGAAEQPGPAPDVEATPAAETSIEKSEAPTRSLAAIEPPKPAPVKTRTVTAR